MLTLKFFLGLFLVFCMYSNANSIKLFDHKKNKGGTATKGHGFGLKDQGFKTQHSAPEPHTSKGKFGFADLKAGFDKEKSKFESKFGLKLEAKLEVPHSQQHEKSKFGFSEIKEKVEDLKSSIVDKFNKPTPKKVTETVQRPICPLRVEPIYEVEVVEQTVHSIETFNENFDSTVWTQVTETLHVPVTVFHRTTTTKEVHPIHITETKIVPEYVDVTKARIFTVEHPITVTNLEVSTYTATNTLTTTLVEPVWITLTEVQTQWVTSTEHVIKTAVEWISATETVTQPIYVTTSIWVEAPQLVLDTTTITSPHYMTTTDYVTNVVHTTICEN